MKKGNVLEIKDLSVDFMTVRGIVYAVQGVDLEVKQGGDTWYRRRERLWKKRNIKVGHKAP